MTKNYDSVETCLLSSSTISSIQELTSYTTQKRILLSFLIMIVSLFSFISTQAQSTANYAFSSNTTGSLALDANGNTVDMSTGTTLLVAAASDQGVSAVTNIGFNYTFNGNSFSQFTVSANGIMQLGSTVVSSSTYVASGGTSALPKFSAIGSDGITATALDGGGVISKVVGTAPNRCLVVQWVSYLWYLNSASPATFQVRLYETSGVVEYVYGEMPVGASTSSNYSVGFSAGALINQVASITTSTNSVSYNVPFATNSYTAATNIANLHSTANGSRRIYAFTPPNIVLGDVTNLTFSTVTSINTTLNWVDNATNEASFLVIRATDAAFTQNVVNSLVTSTTSAGTGTNYSSIQTGLTAGTTYYYKVLAALEGGISAGINGTQATLNGATYYWTGLTGGTWDAFTNWNTAADGTGSIPTAWVTSDIHIIDGAGTTPGGVLSIAVDRASFSIGQIKITSNTNLTLASSATTTRIITISGGPNEDFILEAGSTLNLSSTTNAIAFAFTGSGNTGTIAGTYIASGSTSNTINTTGGTGTLVTVNSTGNITSNLNSSSGCITGNATSLLFENGSNYTHSNSTTINYIPTATWQSTATAALNGNTTGTTLSSGSTMLGNVIINNTLSTATLSAFTTNSRIIQGDLTVNSTGTGRFRAITSGVVLINGNLIVNGGIFEVGSSTGGVIVKGNTTIASGATLDVNQATLQNEGNMVNNGSILSSETTTANSKINFIGTAVPQLFSGSGNFTGRVSSLGVSNPLGLTISTPVLVQRVNLFTGLISGSSNITIGTGLALSAAVQIGVVANTSSGGNFDVSPMFNLGTGTYTILYSAETTPRTTGFEVPSTRSINALILDNSNGLTIAGGTIEVLNGLTLTNGVVTSNLTNHIIHGSPTAAGTLTGGSSTSYIDGPIVRTINDANAATNYILYPVGKAGVYAPIWLAPTTTSASKFVAEAFNTNTGTANPSIIGLSSTRRWEAISTTGTFTDINVRLADASIISTNIPVQATTAAGVYSSAFGSVATFTAGTPNTIQSNFPVNDADYTGFISLATSNICSGTPTPGNTIASSSTICFGESVTLSLQNITDGSGVTYQWKSSTDGVTYTSISGETNSTLVATPTTATYYLCDVTCSAGAVTGTSTAIQVSFTNNITATIPATRCGTGTVDLGATSNIGASVNWYAAQTGGLALASGPTYTTPSIATTTTYYASADVITNVNGLARLAPTGTSGTTPSNYGLVFNANEAFTIKSVDVFLNSTSSGNVTIVLQNNLGTVMQTLTVVVPAGNATSPIQHTLNLDFKVPAGMGYRLIATTGVSMIREASLGGFPYSLGSLGSLTSGYLSGTSTSYYYFYNWSLQTICASERVPVVATVTSAPALTLSASTTAICESDSSNVVTITSTVGDYNSYVWSPSTGVTGNEITGWSFNPSTSTTYTLSATQTSGSLCSKTASFAVTVSPRPSVMVVADVTTCVNTISPLMATGGTLSNITILNENFNGLTNNWITTNASTGGTLTSAAWTLQPDGYLGFNSNDASQFYNTNSDAQGSGGTTNTALDSPTFSTVGFSDATLSFYHYYRHLSSTAKVQYTTDGSTWIDIETYSTTEGTATGFVQKSIALPLAAINQASVKIRFKYDGAYSWYWAIDNVLVTGTQATTISWSPISNLYTDAAATVAYVANTNAPTIYFKSATASTATTYTITSTTSQGCFRTTTADVTVNALTSNSTTITACDSYTWAENGMTYTASGVYTSVTGCNTETLNLTITTGSSLPNEVVSVCDTYTWAANGTTYTTGGTYTSTTNCVTRTLDLTINASPSNATTQSGDTLSATETGATYQWLLCDGSFTPISGATSQSYLVTAIGNYAVDVTKNGCTVRSACVNVTALGNATFDLTKLSYYPNPVLDMFTVRYSENITSIDVYDLSGRRVKNSTSNNTEVTLNMSDLAASVYVVKVFTEGKSSEFKIVKK